jgi:hypothetical protein
MAIRIEAPETLRLIEELCRRTGEDPETAVRVAVEEMYARIRASEQGQASPTQTPDRKAERPQGRL